MSCFRHGDPLDDFVKLDAEQARYYERLPRCDRCRNKIEDEDYFDIEGEILCEDCVKKKYMKSTHEYTEGYM